MATIRKRGKSWEALVVRKHGDETIRKSGSFSTKAEASAWAARTETEILDGKRGKIPDKTFGDLLLRYANEVSPTKRGERWERIRIKSIMDIDPLAKVRLCDLDARDIGTWRDRRLKSIAPGSVLREWTLLSNACSVAAKEWKWLTENPMIGVRRPATPRPRDRLMTENEIERLLWALGYDRNQAPKSSIAKVGAAMLFAIETAMRAGEIINLTWADIDIDVRVAKIGSAKTDAGVRNVPLSTEAVRILNQLNHSNPEQNTNVFGMTSALLDALFRRGKSRALITDLHFHDTRHLAITRLSKKLDVMALARMVGHRDLKMLMVYYNESAQELAKRLD